MTSALSIGVHRSGSGLRVGHWYYTRALASLVDSVDSLSAPLSPGHLLRLGDAETRRRFMSLAQNCLPARQPEKPASRVFLSLWPASPSRFRNTRFAFRHAYHLGWPRLPSRQYDFIYIDNPYLESVVDAIFTQTLVVRVPDVIRASSGEPLFEVWQRLFGQAVLVIASAPAIRDQLLNDFGVEALLIPNGVELAPFRVQQPCPVDYERFSRNMVYVGAFDERVDLELLQELARLFPDTGLHLIGPASARQQKAVQSSNVCWHGPKSPDEVPGWLQHADVGLIPFRLSGDREFLDGINPLKAYVYLAAGLPVVSSDFAGVHGISSWVKVADTARAFSEALQEALQARPDAEVVRQSVTHCDWSERLKPFVEFVRARL